MIKRAWRFLSLFKVLLFLISISLSAIVLSCSTPNPIAKEPGRSGPYQANARLFDNLYDLITGMAEEVKKQPAERTYYFIGNEDIRLASVADDESKEAPLAYASMADMKGQAYVVSRVSGLDPHDIEVVYIEKSSYRLNDPQHEQYIIGFLFKQDSWDRVHETTTKLQGKRLALLKGETVLSVAKVIEPLTWEAAITGSFKKEDIEWFTQGLTLTDPPPAKKRGLASLDWLEKQVDKYPDDTSSIMELARRFSENKESDCKKASVIYERVIQLDPSGAGPYYLPFLHSCFKESGTFDKAITFYNKLVVLKKTSPQAELSIRMALAEAYSQTGDTHKALNELEQSLSVAEALPVSFPWLEESTHKGEIEKQLNDGKIKIVQAIKAAITKMKSEGFK